MILHVLNGLNDMLDDAGIRERGDVTELILLTREDLPENSPHDLAGSCLWQVVYDVNCLHLEIDRQWSAHPTTTKKPHGLASDVPLAPQTAQSTCAPAW